MILLCKKSPSSTPTPASPSSSQKSSKQTWCVAKAGVTEEEMQASLDYACGQGIDCSPIQPGGACFEPASIASHATYAMNLLYQNSDKNPLNCDFSHTATLTSADPSKFVVLIRYQTFVSCLGWIMSSNCLCLFCLCRF